MKETFRKRKIQLISCDSCGSLLVDVYPKSLTDFYLLCKNTSCGQSQKVINGWTLKNAVESNYAEFETPQIIDLKFDLFNFPKTQWKKADIKALCFDRTGLPYQFKGNSAVNIVYYAIKDKWFRTRVCWQKYWPTTRGENGFQMFCQRPKIIDEIILLNK